jgi:hypothetical protein
MNCKLVLILRSQFFHNLRFCSSPSEAALDHPALWNHGKGVSFATL